MYAGPVADADSHDTIAQETRHRTKVERSLFIGIAFPVSTDDAFFTGLAAIAKEHFDATHHCWAFRLEAGGEIRARSSDAGEPSGTAGKPILNAIESAALTDVAVVVVRYYGGVKLGTGGLARAYRQCAAETLGRSRRERTYLYERFEIDAPFHAMSAIYRMISPPEVLLVSEEFGETNRFTLDVRHSRAERIEQELVERRIRFVRSPKHRFD